eukprot:CAMPEP_0196701486 /NCGR_PEP_ID=MMETSP1090-20130531/51612_1 /TAXON_ID=37098 /ORGANISM="Isochrysis sp, Strain CCMP1244" /LENGTH=88 /DNA_ID=CAMNT_0042041271 /DNA_START=222 /DNA_END=489 /DNA_ORIENTATION=+
MWVARYRTALLEAPHDQRILQVSTLALRAPAQRIPFPIWHREKGPAEAAQLPPFQERRTAGLLADEVGGPIHLDGDASAAVSMTASSE